MKGLIARFAARAACVICWVGAGENQQAAGTKENYDTFMF